MIEIKIGKFRIKGGGSDFDGSARVELERDWDDPSPNERIKLVIDPNDQDRIWAAYLNDLEGELVLRIPLDEKDIKDIIDCESCSP